MVQGARECVTAILLTAAAISGCSDNENPLGAASQETGWPDHAPFRGALDEFRLYTRALSAAEVRVPYLKR